jgi:hypothetical protein
MRITIFSPPGTQGEVIRSRALAVLHEMGVKANVSIDNDEFDFARAGVMFTPAVSINGTLISNGWIPEPDEIKLAVENGGN